MAAPAAKESRERKAEAIDLILRCETEGMRPSAIEPLLAEYGVCERTIRNWFAEAEGRQGRDAARERDLWRGRVLNGYLAIIRRAEEGVPTAVRVGKEVVLENIPDLPLAKNTYDSLCKMLGLNAPAQIEVDDRREDRDMRERDTRDLRERLNTLRTNGGARTN